MATIPGLNFIDFDLIETCGLAAWGDEKMVSKIYYHDTTLQLRIEELEADDTRKNSQIHEYLARIEELEAALKTIADGKDNLGWAPCAYIAEAALAERNEL